MQISVTAREPALSGNACRVIPLPRGRRPGGRAANLDRKSGGRLSRRLEQGDFHGRAGECLIVHDLDEANPQRAMLFGIGDGSSSDTHSWLSAFESLGKALVGSGADEVLVDVSPLGDDEATLTVRLNQLVRALFAAMYRFRPPTNGVEPRIERLVLLVPRPCLDACRQASERAAATAEGMNLTRDLGNLPPNLCTPIHLADTARALARRYESLDVEVLDEPAMKQLGMQALLSVGAGSSQPTRLIALSHRGRSRRRKPIVLVGKGVTFDTGGISIKGSDGMDEMKYDMCGAAAVFGVMDACCRLQLDMDVVGVVAAVENMPDGSAYRPGDVITSLSGKQIEILNTDAEGRLALADALSWSARYKPAALIDIATLTGAAVVALGAVASAVFSNDDALRQALVDAGDHSGDRTWPMPIWDAYQSQLDSNFADMANIGGRKAGAITAACFLSRFTEDEVWAHLDIAGVAWSSGSDKGASGRPVPLLMQYLFSRL